MDGAGTTRPSWDPSIGMLHRLFAALETGQPYGIGAYLAYRHDPLTGMPDAEAMKRALDKLKLLVSIDVRYSETGWYSDVILPESTYLERANILGQMPGPVPVFLMRDQAIAPRFDSRPAWWIFREILRRMGIKEALDFETIEEIWNYQLEGTGVTVAEMREQGIVALAGCTEADAARQAQVPDPLRQDRDRERGPEEGGAAQPAALRAEGGAVRRPLHPALLEDRDAGARPVPQQPDPQRDRAGTGALDPPRPREAAGHRRRRGGRGQRRRSLRRKDEGQGDALDPPGGGLHAARLRGDGAGRARAPSAEASPTSACSTASWTSSTRPEAAVP